ncbi:MAG: rab-GTPase-TBC domain-containing protein, partial [Piptocephalis tieghemiana]
FWGPLLKDYEGMSFKHPRRVARRVQDGIPDPVRGMCWQVMAGPKDPSLESQYASLLDLPCRDSRTIEKDLPRTYPQHPYFSQEGSGGQSALGRVVRAYAVYDDGVGYCQGMAFIAGALLLHMPEEAAFGVLVRLMDSYGLRSHYTPRMPGLRRRLYQFSRLLERHDPEISTLLSNEGIAPEAFVAPWLLTCFGYRSPLTLVLRTLDVLLAEGPEALVRVAVAIVRRGRSQILQHGSDFESLMPVLQDGRLLDPEGDRWVEEVLQEATLVRARVGEMSRWAEEWEEHVTEERGTEERERWERQVRQREEGHAEEENRLRSKVSSLEAELEELRREQCILATAAVEERVAAGEARDRAIQAEKALKEERDHGEARVQGELEELASRNASLLRERSELEDRVEALDGAVMSATVARCEAEDKIMQLEIRLAREVEYRRQADEQIKDLQASLISMEKDVISAKMALCEAEGEKMDLEHRVLTLRKANTRSNLESSTISTVSEISLED